MSQVALVNMPWSTVHQGSIALGILKRVLRRQRIPSDIYYLNLRLARRMNLKVYETISNIFLVGDWLFAQHLFGEFGSRELKNTYADIARDQQNGAKPLIDSLHINHEQITRDIIPLFLEECLNEIDWSRYNIVGFTSLFTQHVSSLLLARAIKHRFPSVKIVFGGANVEGVMGEEALRSFDWIDYVVDGEAEQNFPALVKNILGRKFDEPVAGISFRCGTQVVIHQERPSMIPLDQVPIPDYSDYFKELDNSGLRHRARPFVLFESSRGCWWGEKAHCTFCGLNGQSMKYRTKSPRRVLREIIVQSKRCETLNFGAVDNILDTHSFSNLLPQIAAKNLDLQFFYEVKSNLTEEQVKLLQDARVKYIQPGIESLNTQVLKLMRKGVTAMQNIQLLKWCGERGLDVTWNILYGFPGETRHHYEQMLPTIFSLMHLMPPVHTVRIVVDRYSPYFFDSERLGIQDVRPKSMYYYIYPEQRVNLQNIAYHFDYSLHDSQEDPKNYIDTVKKAVILWQKLFEMKKVFFEFRKGPNFVELLDSRPLSFEGKMEVRRTILKGLKKIVYEFCGSNKPFQQVVHHADEHFNLGTNEKEVRRILSELVESKLMYCEKDRYLSLALPSSKP
jgi:ribosomal peptide maturation radical SAM protein 1